MVWKKDPNSAEVDHEDIEESDDGDDGQRRGANQRRSDGICQAIGLIRDGYVSSRNTRSSFAREALRGSWVYLPLDQRSETTSHQKWHEVWLQCFQQCTNCGSWFISDFFTNYTFTNFSIIFITGFRIYVNRYTENPAPERSGSTSVKLRWDPLRETTQTENKNKNGESEEVQRDISHELLDWPQEFKEIWLMKVLQQNLGRTQSREVKTLPSHLINFQRSCDQKWNQVLSFEDETYKGFLQETYLQSCPERKIWVI